MEKIITMIFLLSVFYGCSKEKPQIKLFSPSAFAYSLDKGWELNATVMAKGFAQKETEDDKYQASIDYNIDLIIESGDTLSKFDFGKITEIKDEEILDLTIELQSEFDENFKPGKYQIIFTAEDLISKTKDTLNYSFNYSL